MDLLFLTSVSIVLCIFLLIAIRVGFLWRDERQAKRRKEVLAAMRDTQPYGAENKRQTDRETEDGPAAAGGSRGAAIVGGVRRAARRRPVRRQEDDVDWAQDDEDRDFDDDDDETADLIAAPDGKIGKKKQAKLEAKAERKAQREAEIEEREERKRRQEEREARIKEEEEKEAELERIKEEEERKAREEKEAREHEEYLALKEQFEVEEEGYEEQDPEKEENLLQEFVNYVKQKKVVNMDELASHFQLKTPDAISRLKTLVEDGTLTGVIDDRGKFIYITMDELHAVAKFINQRGRVSVSELADYSNKLIKLESDTAVRWQTGQPPKLSA